MAKEEDDDSDQTQIISSGEVIQCGSPYSLPTITTFDASNNKSKNTAIRTGHSRSSLQEAGSRFITIPEGDHIEFNPDQAGEGKRRRPSSITESTPLLSTLQLPSILLSDKRHQLNQNSRSCFFEFATQAIVILEVASLIFFVTLLLYTKTYPTNYDRNKNAIGLFAYVLFMMAYSLFSLQFHFAIGIKVVFSLTKLFVTSIFFTLCLEHTSLLPVFFFYFFPTIIATCVNFFFT